MGGVHGDAHRGDAEVVPDVGQDPQAFLLGRDLRRQGAADERRVQGALGEVAEMVAVVARCHGDRLDVMVRIEPILPEHDAAEDAGRGLPRVDADPAALQLLDRAVVVAGKQPEHRPVGVDAQNRPRVAGCFCYSRPAVSVIVNGIKPYQNATAIGPKGQKDYSRWTFLIPPKYTIIKEGVNKIASKISCDNKPSLVSYYTLNVTGLVGSGGSFSSSHPHVVTANNPPPQIATPLP